MVFRGTFEHSLDAKHRLTVPAAFRAALSGRLVLAFSHETKPGTPRAIAVWPQEQYDHYASAVLSGRVPISPEARELQRFLFNNSHESELDSANRVMIPPTMLRYAGLDKEVVVTGSGEFLEVWDREAYAAYNEDLLARFSEIAASGNTD